MLVRLVGFGLVALAVWVYFRIDQSNGPDISQLTDLCGKDDLTVGVHRDGEFLPCLEGELRVLSEL